MARLVVLYLGSLAFRSFILAILALLGTLFSRRVEAHHAIWAAVLLIMLLMPLVDFVLPISLVPDAVERVRVISPSSSYLINPDSPEFSPTTTEAPFAVTDAKTLNLWETALILYAAIAAVLLFRLAWAYRTLSGIKRSGQRIQTPILNTVESGTIARLYESDLVRVPLASGLTCPVVLLPIGWKTWDEWKLRAVLCHEAAHIKRGDCLFAFLAAINASVYWFNPMSWCLQRHLSSLAERASDEAAMLLNGDPVRYAEVLLQFVADARQGRRLRIGGVAMAKHNMQSRIEGVLAMKSPGNGTMTKAGWVAVLAIAIAVLYASGVVYLAAQSSTSSVISALSSWPERVTSIITVEEKWAYERLQTDAERQHFIEQFWSRRFPSWPDQVAYIIKDEERGAYESLRADEERRLFIEQFWSRMDPTPGTRENEFRNEYYRRLEYASRTFTQASNPEWWKSDRGRIYIMYGQPDELRSYPAGDLRIPTQPQAVPYRSEQWRYRQIRGLGENVIFNFVDSNGTGDFHLLIANAGQVVPTQPRLSDSQKVNSIPQPPAADQSRKDCVACFEQSPVNPQVSFSSQLASNDRPSFELVWIKETVAGDPRSTGLALTLPDGGYSTKGARLRFLIQNAYGVRRYQVLGGPDWIDTASYEIEAKAKSGTSTDPKQIQLMVQSLLEDRFHLKFHRETRFLPVYVLTVAYGGPRLKQPKDDGCYTPNPNSPPPMPIPGQPVIPPCGRAVVSITPSGAEIAAAKASMAALTATLSSLLGQTVLDKTEFTESFDAHLAFAPDQALAGLPGEPYAGQAAPADATTIFKAIETQLGLKLETGTGPVEMLVIDHIERAAEN